ncbi:MAG: haloacid dehalogenase-like hydrolase, partial [Anaerolineae bacterium]|nr:haloacid dehalogenase-like hydrolase [Anaerolineae bacterium]
MLILWDIDGTLLRGKGLGKAVTSLAIREVYGVEDSVDHHYFGGKTDWQSLLELLTPHGVTPETVAERLEPYMHAKARHMQAIIGQYNVQPLPGAMEALTAFRARPELAHGLVTGNVQATVPVKLRAAGYDPAWFIAAAYGHESVSRNDLPPLAVRRAEAVTGRVFTPEQVWVIGDTVSDVECARASGYRVAVVTTGFDSVEALRAAAP